jgi:oligogalacturonide lyase
VHIGYHGRHRHNGRSFFGAICYDNTEMKEFTFPYHSTHFHSNDFDLIVGDGTAAFAPNAQPYILLFKRVGDEFVGPRILAFHRSTFNDQHAHPHPRFTPDGRHVLHSSDLTGYANIYYVEVGDFFDLPELTGRK